MKKISIVLSVIAIMISLTGALNAKKMVVLNTDKGELPNDNGGEVEVTLSEEHSATKGGLTLKVTASAKGKGWIGEINPKRGVWDGYECFKVDVFNPGNKPATLNFVVKPTSGADYNERFDSPIVIRPGKSTAEVQISGANTNGGKGIDLSKKIAQWIISNFQPKQVLYFQNFRLETEGDEKEEPKAQPKVEKKGGKK